MSINLKIATNTIKSVEPTLCLSLNWSSHTQTGGKAGRLEGFVVSDKFLHSLSKPRCLRLRLFQQVACKFQHQVQLIWLSTNDANARIISMSSHQIGCDWSSEDTHCSGESQRNNQTHISGMSSLQQTINERLSGIATFHSCCTSHFCSFIQMFWQESSVMWPLTGDIMWCLCKFAAGCKLNSFIATSYADNNKELCI